MASGPPADVLQDNASAGAGDPLDVRGMRVAVLEIVASDPSDRVVSFQASLDGETYTQVQAVNLGTGSAALITTPTPTPQLWRLDVSGLRSLRTPIAGGTTGTVTVIGVAVN